MHCLYHADCSDGFGAAWAVRKKFPGAAFDAVKYSDPMPAIADGKTVYIVDFSYPPEQLVDLCRRSKEVIVFDHHKSAVDSLVAYFDEYRAPANLKLHLDLRQSGAGIAWRQLFPGEPLPWLIRYVEDNDLWRFAYPETKSVMAYVQIQPRDFAAWDFLATQDPVQVAKIGETLRIKEAQEVQWHLKNARSQIALGGFIVPCCNAPRYLVNEIGGALAVDQPFAACYYEDAKWRYYSLRSIKGVGEDVNLIAEMYGGGGHPNAAGFFVPKPQFTPEKHDVLRIDPPAA